MMDKRLTTLHRNRRVVTLINELGLAKCSDTRLSALSGGEAKKVSLAVQVSSIFRSSRVFTTLHGNLIFENKGQIKPNYLLEC